MSENPWDRRPGAAREEAQDRLLAEWLSREVVPFNRFWSQRIGPREITSVRELSTLDVVEESGVAGAGGPGNPALLLMPTEEGFKRHATRLELVAASREVGSGGIEARRAALFRRYKPVHVHEAGVGLVMAIAYTRTDLDRLHLAGARLVEVLGLGADDRMVNAVPAAPSVRFWGLYHAALAARMTALHPVYPGERPAASVARAIAMLPPTVLAARRDDAVALLAELAERRVRTPDLRTLLLVGPPPPTKLREDIAALVRRLGAGAVRVQAVWAPEASRMLWGECRPPTADPLEASYGLHTYPDLEIVEVRELARGGSAKAGEPGEIVLTSLGWRGTALLRFATGAWTGGLVTVPCPNCRRTVPRLAPAAAEAPWQPKIQTADGKTVRVDLRRAPRVLNPRTLHELGIRDWSLRVVNGSLVLGLDLQTRDRQVISDLARAVGRAVGAVPVVRVGEQAAGQRPQLGDAGP